ncbi:tRNA pseudouridine(38/39) synthase isoform X2 [Punica granatum]|uniref:tRNA pseudouridine(38/39) synthase isoform X2 n=1 Tax=Punica granatum TaxID=22663 RepID=A0A6P8DE58_PUNGR|nr:tRNA pseudouridine(38/39) synthase isoform X2 [Punica granatum]
MSASIGSDLIRSLQSEIVSLHNRVKELEEENAKLSTRLSECCCEKTRSNSNSVANGGNSVYENGAQIRKSNKTKKKKEYIAGTIEHLPKRYVALRVLYFGQRFYGFASEAQLDPTVESELFKALEKTRLLVGDRKKSQYSRCGRTDKGVSAVGQVIALFLRSNLKETNENDNMPCEFGQRQDGEIDYVRVLNRALPKDIRVTGWCPVPVGFSARFSCLSREYKYFFWRDDLNISAMEHAGKKFIGEHDFRNFCKMDAANVHHYRRHISSFELIPCNKSFDGNQLWVIKVTGSAFLWHQVRCMVAVLFMVGQGLESPQILEFLLDTDRTQRKPQYAMASEIPLVLQSCQFEGLTFTCSSDAFQALRIHLENECRAYELQAAMYHEALLNLLPEHVFSDRTSLSSGTSKKVASHVPLISRPTELVLGGIAAELMGRN